MGVIYGKPRRMQAGDTDQRMRITVLLVAEKRPKYWDFHCVKCGQKVCELSGDVAALFDVADLESIPDYQPAPVLFECKGKFCRIWYEIGALS